MLQEFSLCDLPVLILYYSLHSLCQLIFYLISSCYTMSCSNITAQDSANNYCKRSYSIILFHCTFLFHCLNQVIPQASPLFSAPYYCTLYLIQAIFPLFSM